MKAICLNCTLKRSPEPTSTGALAQVLLDALGEQDVASEQIRLADHRIEPGVISEAVVEGDEWPDLRRRLAAEILIVATPTWLGQPSSIAKRALERMDALLSETYPGNDLPIAYNRVAGVVVTGSEKPPPGAVVRSASVCSSTTSPRSDTFLTCISTGAPAIGVPSRNDSAPVSVEVAGTTSPGAPVLGSLAGAGEAAGAGAGAESSASVAFAGRPASTPTLRRMEGSSP